MRTFLHFCTTILGLLIFLQLDAQSLSSDYDVIQISIGKSYYQKQPKYREFVRINLRDSTITYQKKLSSKPRMVEPDSANNILIDTSIHEKLKRVAKLSLSDNPICIYHNEKRYFKVDLIQTTYRNIPIYTESYILNRPYKCTDLDLEKLINQVLTSYWKILKNQ